MSELSERIGQLSPKRLALLALDLEERLEASERALREPIAIIGLACRFPGAEEGPDAFWRLLRSGVDAVAEVPADRWDVSKLYDPNPDAPGRVATKWGGFLRDCRHFDHTFFGISPREALSMDPQQRLFLETSWEAFEHAGISTDDVRGSATGVFVGICNSDYSHLLMRREREAIDAYLASGNAFSVVSGRLSYLLGLHGPSLSVDTACSSSLVAVHLACQSLRTNECRMALAGGVNLMLSPDPTVALSRARMMAPDGRCKTFAATADGFVRGEGSGVVLLKRLSDAEADDDRILAVIRGSAVNQDGRSSGLTAPNGPSQEAVIRAALSFGSVAPAEVDYVEAHGTGTTLGDPIEVRALGTALGEGRPADRPVKVGSVKTNIGHLESAAGVAGLIKLVLALEHEEIPGQLHFTAPNPHIAWNDLPVEVTARPLPWIRGDRKRIGAVSSFGFSGTNAHLVVEEAPVRARRTPTVDRPLHVLPLSAKTDAALSELAARYASHLRQCSSDRIADVCFTAGTGRSHFEHRAAIVAANADAALPVLDALARGERSACPAQHAPIDAPGVAFLFTGQGSQYAGMARALYDTQPAFRAALDRCAERAVASLDRPLLDVVFSSGNADLLNETRYTQPALFAIEYALAAMWRAWGVEPVAVAGHSVGEFAAACVAGVFSLEDGLRLIAARGRLMQALPAGGAMAAISTLSERVSAALTRQDGQVSIAAINAPDEVVVSGDAAAVEELCQAFASQGVRTQRLAVSHAFHSGRMIPMLEAFRREAEAVTYAPPRIALVSNVTGELMPAGQIPGADYWCRHVMATVQFSRAVETLYRGGHRIFLEIGPHPTLTGLGSRTVIDSDVAWLPSLRRKKDDWQTLLSTLSELYVRGVSIVWSGFDAEYSRARVSLPTYPFERHYFWPSILDVDRPAVPAHREPWRDALYEMHWERDADDAVPVVEPAVIADRLAPRVQALYAEHGGEVYNALYPELDAVCAAYVVQGLRTLGCELRAGDGIAPATLADQLGIVPAHRRLFTRLFTILAEEGYLSPADGGWIVTAAPPVGDPAAMMQGLLKRFPECQAELAFTARSAPALASVLRGSADPIQVLFPAGSLEGAEAVYERAPGLRIFNTLAAEAIAAAIAGRTPGRKLRVLEIGAGTGGTSTYVLPQLPPDMTKYVYTDVSSLFTARAREKFAKFNFVDYRTLDIERDPVAQGYLEGSFDIVIGANVLHATADLFATMTNVRKLLAPDGLLVLLETTKTQRFGDLTVGYTEGWWRFTDTERRPSYALLSGAGWRSLLAEAGFQAATTIGGLDDGREIVANQALVLARAIGRAPTADQVIVICGDGDDVSADVTGRARQAGADVCLVRRSSGDRVGADGTLTVDPMRPEQVQRLVREVKQRFAGRRLKVVDLWPLSASLADGASADEASRTVAAATAPSLYLAQACAAEAGLEAQLMIVTRGTQTVGDPSRAAELAQAPVWGLGQVVDLEHPELRCTLIDLQAPQMAVDGRLLYDTIVRAETGERQFAIANGSRYVRRMARAQVAEAVAGPLALKEDATYLITGGLSGLGLLVAERFANLGARSLVLVGRREPGPDAAAVIGTLQGRGVNVLTVAADVSQEEHISRIFHAVASTRTPLQGVIHAAGATDDASLLHQDWARFERVMAAKVRGAWLLHRATAEMALDFFVLFSTGASFLGSPGQSNHASANMFLDVLARHRRARSLPALSINWGAWSELGAATRGGVVERVATRGLRPITPEHGLAVMEFLMGVEADQVAVLPIDWPEFLKAVPATAPLLSRFASPSDRRTAAEPARVVAEAVPTAAGLDALRAMTPQRSRATLLDWINEEAVRVLGLAASEVIDPARPLNALGLDSLMAVDLRNALGNRIGRTLPATLLFNYPTVGELLDFLVCEVLDETAQGGGITSIPVPTTESAATPIELEDLSEDELAALLAGKLSGA